MTPQTPSPWRMPIPGEPGGPPFVLRTLGAQDLADATGPCRALLAQPKRLALLVYLTMGRDTSFRRRDTLLPLFWPDRESGQARAALRQSIRFLRTTLGPNVVEARGAEEVRLLPGAVWHDVSAFRAAAAAGASAEALALYRGEFLAGFFVANAGPEFDEWMSGERLALLRTAVDAVSHLAAQHEQADRLEEAVQVTRGGVVLDPLNEPLHRQLMILLDALGDRAGALETYELLARRLEREMDASPSVDTRTLRDRIHKRGAASSTRPRTVTAERMAAAAAVSPQRPVQAEVSRSDGRQSIVILPFEGREQHDVALGTGIAEMMHAVLQSAPELSLAPLASEALAQRVRRDSDAGTRLTEASMLVDGEVARTSDGLLVSVRVIDGRDRRVCWQEQFARPAREIFSLQEVVTRGVAAALGVRLAASDEPRLRRPTPDLEAYNLFLRGRWHWTKRPRETRRALDFLQRAVARDPLFALAHAAIADCYNTLGSWEASELPAWEAFPQAHAAARKALDLDPGLAEGRTALGYAEMHYTWRRDVAERHLAEAVALAPTYGHAHHWHSHLLIATGRVADSLEASRNALACDPLDPVLNVHMAWHHWLAREPNDGLAQCERTLDMHPGDHWSPFFAGLCEVQQGRADVAVTSFRTALERSAGSLVMASGLAHALAVQGEHGEARRMLVQLEAAADSRRLLAYEVALVHLALGESDRAFQWLDRAYEERSAWLAYAAVEPRLDEIRADERFRMLLRNLRLG